MAHLVDTPLGAFIVRCPKLAARLARELGGTVVPLVDVPPEPVVIAQAA